jgi:RNA ligase (TIGR02306 family)
MSTFSVEAFEIQISSHPDPEVHSIELAQVGGYRSIVRKGQYKTGDVALFIPPQAIVPDNLLKELGLFDEEKGKGRLKGEGNRLGPARFRGVLSEGLVYCPEFPLETGVDYSAKLGITKYEPIIPNRSKKVAVFSI